MHWMITVCDAAGVEPGMESGNIWGGVSRQSSGEGFKLEMRVSWFQLMVWSSEWKLGCCLWFCANHGNRDKCLFCLTVQVIHSVARENEVFVCP